jgi:hypothetical protein
MNPPLMSAEVGGAEVWCSEDVQSYGSLETGLNSVSVSSPHSRLPYVTKKRLY